MEKREANSPARAEGRAAGGRRIPPRSRRVWIWSIAKKNKSNQKQLGKQMPLHKGP
jgi:hypothetical protein